MKKLTVFLTAFLLTSASVFANGRDNDSSVDIDGVSYDFGFSWKKQSKKARGRAGDVHWAGLGLAFMGLDGLDNYNITPNRGRSYCVNLNLVDASLPLSRHFVLGSGLGFDFARYHFNGNVSLQDVEGSAQFIDDPQGRSYKDSKALLTYMKSPFLIEYQTRANRLGARFFANVGVELMLKIWSKSEIIVKSTDGLKRINYGGYNAFPATARFVGRIGFTGFNIFGYYQPMSLFAGTKGVELYPWGIGFSFGD